MWASFPFLGIFSAKPFLFRDSYIIGFGSCPLQNGGGPIRITCLLPSLYWYVIQWRLWFYSGLFFHPRFNQFWLCEGLWLLMIALFFVGVWLIIPETAPWPLHCPATTSIYFCVSFFLIFFFTGIPFSFCAGLKESDFLHSSPIGISLFKIPWTSSAVSPKILALF